jgi:hypothetical protein
MPIEYSPAKGEYLRKTGRSETILKLEQLIYVQIEADEILIQD